MLLRRWLWVALAAGVVPYSGCLASGSGSEDDSHEAHRPRGHTEVTVAARFHEFADALERRDPSRPCRYPTPALAREYRCDGMRARYLPRPLKRIGGVTDDVFVYKSEKNVIEVGAQLEFAQHGSLSVRFYRDQSGLWRIGSAIIGHYG